MKNIMSEVHSPLFYGIKPDELNAMLSCIGYHIGTFKKGDIVAYNYNRGKSNDASHIMVFMGFNSKGNPLFNTWGHYRKLNSEHSTYANRKINMIIRLKKTSL